jgi:hypothetical protein
MFITLLLIQWQAAILNQSTDKSEQYGANGRVERAGTQPNEDL